MYHLRVLCLILKNDRVIVKAKLKPNANLNVVFCNATIFGFRILSDAATTFTSYVFCFLNTYLSRDGVVVSTISFHLGGGG